MYYFGNMPVKYNTTIKQFANSKYYYHHVFINGSKHTSPSINITNKYFNILALFLLSNRRTFFCRHSIELQLLNLV